MIKYLILFLALTTFCSNDTSMDNTVRQAELLNFLALGDSYTIGQSVEEADRWPVQLVKKLNEKGHAFNTPQIIAKTGWRTDQLKEAIESATLTPDFQLVSLLIGVNNQYQGRSAESYAPEFEELLQMAIELAGGKKENVFVLSIPDYGFTSFGSYNQPGITAGIDAFNAVNKSITEKYNIAYINITDISRRGLEEPDLIASDNLHPSGLMYAKWVERLVDELPIFSN